MKQCLSLVLIFLFLSLPGISGAVVNEKEAFTKSIELYSSGKFYESSKILVMLIKQNPQKSLYWFNLGNCAFMIKSYENAAKYFQKVVSLGGGLSVPAKLYQAKALMMLEKNEQAAALLHNLIAANPPPGILQEAKMDLANLQNSQFINQQSTFDIELERKTQPYWAYFDSSYGTRDNPYLESASVSPISSPLLKLVTGAGYHFNRGRAWSEKISYMLSYENPQEATDLQTVVHTLEGPFILRKKRYELNLIPYFQKQDWDNSPASQKMGLTVKNIYETADYEMGLDIDASSQSASDSSYSYLEGSSYSLRPYYGFWSDSTYVQVFALLGKDGSQDINYADGSRLPLQHSYQGLGLRNTWRFSGKTTLYFNLSYLKKTFQNLSLPENKQRTDDETSGSLKIAYKLFQKFFVYGAAEYISNKSALVLGDVRDKNYAVSTISMGVSWDAF